MQQAMVQSILRNKSYEHITYKYYNPEGCKYTATSIYAARD